MLAIAAAVLALCAISYGNLRSVDLRVAVGAYLVGLTADGMLAYLAPL